MKLRINTGREAGRDVPLDGRLVIGRAEDCALRVIDEAASRRHAEIAVEAGGAALRDLGSSNGTRLNGVRVSEAVLSDGDVIGIGATEMVFLAAPEAERSTVLERGAPPGGVPAATVPERPRVTEAERLSRLAPVEPEIVGEAPVFMAALEDARRSALVASPVLITGPTGSGKELVARMIHRLGRRAGGPFVPVNCAAIPHGLIESELFGHEAGAFTGAARRRAGCFELADGGTLFLDEVGELPVDLQARLLRVLESSEFCRVGGVRPVRVDVRVLAATNRDVEGAVRTGRLREDVFFRLNVLRIRLPALAERAGDVPLLTRYFLRRKGAEMKKPGLSFSPEALAALERYPWPGNVRELANVVERALVLESGEVIGIGDLPADVVAGRPHAGADPAEPARPMTLDEAERRAVLAALTHTGWKKGEAAKLLDVSWPTLNKKIEKFGLKPPGG